MRAVLGWVERRLVTADAIYGVIFYAAVLPSIPLAVAVFGGLKDDGAANLSMFGLIMIVLNTIVH